MTAREFRRRAGISLADAAAELGLHPSALSRKERGERHWSLGQALRYQAWARKVAARYSMRDDEIPSLDDLARAA